jgi:hypothetical protein
MCQVVEDRHHHDHKHHGNGNGVPGRHTIIKTKKILLGLNSCLSPTAKLPGRDDDQPSTVQGTHSTLNPLNSDPVALQGSK